MRAESVRPTISIDRRGLSDVSLYGGLFAASVTAFCANQLVGRELGRMADIVAIAGDATCGWSWLLVRALFPAAKPRPAVWPLLLVLTLVATGAVLRFSEGGLTPLARMVGNLGGLVSSTLLLLAAIEPLKNLGPNTPAAERRFRLMFAAGYVALLVIAVLWVDGAPTGELGERWRVTVKPVCALLALLGMGLAIWRRRRHPLPMTASVRRRTVTAEAERLGASIRRLMTQDEFYARQNLKVADLARALGEPEYKVTQCVTGALGFRNFNHMANHLRVEEAKRRLVDPAHERLPILTIAYDCGFGSIGPFNRAFKAETGVTPQRFRRDRAL